MQQSTKKSPNEVFKQFFYKLVAMLPVDDTLFLAKLYSCDLLPGDLMNEIIAKETRAQKAMCFLNGKIMCDISIGDFNSFNKLLNIMEESENDSLKDLAKKIKSVMQEDPVVNIAATSESPAAAISESHLTTHEPPAKKKRESTALDVAADALRTRYLGQLPTAEADWPKHLVTSYMRLTLVDKEDTTDSFDRMDYIKTLTRRGGVDRIVQKKQPIYDLREIFHYNSKPIPRLILIMGGPGIGKTTLSNEICIRWARDGFLSDDFNVVILVALRTIQQRPLEDIFMKLIGEKAYQLLKELLGAQCLIILEGLDEVAVENNSLLMELITDVPVEFVKAKIVITSRPNACKELKANRTIEIMGFGDKEIMEFVQNSFPGDTQSVDTFNKQLNEYPHIYSLCYVPLSLVMIVRIFKYNQQSLPSTLTELYHLFIVLMLKREEKRKLSVNYVFTTEVCTAKEILCKLFADISSEKIKLVFALCKLAYYGLFNQIHEEEEPEIVFTENDLIQAGIRVTDNFDGYGLLQVESLYQLTGDYVTYNFIHLTVQEFLCAVYMLTLSQEEQCHLLKEYFDDYPNIMKFYCGLTELDLNQIIFSKLASPLSTVTAVKCLYERQRNMSPYKLSSPLILDISDITLLPYDCLCVSYFYCHYPVTKLKLSQCSLEYPSVSAEALAKLCLNKATKLQELNFIDNCLTSEEMKPIMKIMISSPSLRVLDVSCNDIGDDGISCLQQINTLTELMVANCNLSVKGASYIKVMLENNKLQHLDIGGNPLGDDGVRLIVEGVQHNNTLTELIAWSCDFSVEGAKHISEMIKINHTIQVLDLSCNFGDEEIAVIAKSLDNARISELNVSECGITDTGAESLAAGLKNNHTIKLLDVRDTDITVDGAVALFEAAETNTVCQKVEFNNIDYGYSSDSYCGSLYSDCEDDGMFLEYNSEEQLRWLMRSLEMRRERNKKK